MRQTNGNICSPGQYTKNEDSNPYSDFEPYLRPRFTNLRVHETVWRPPTDSFETDAAYCVRIELAGISAKDIEAWVEEGCLTIQGRRQDDSPSGKLRYSQAEIKYGFFEVCMRLPADVDVQSICLTYNNGFLEAVLPKKAQPTVITAKVIIRIV